MTRIRLALVDFGRTIDTLIARLANASGFQCALVLNTNGVIFAYAIRCALHFCLTIPAYVRPLTVTLIRVDAVNAQATVEARRVQTIIYVLGASWSGEARLALAVVADRVRLSVAVAVGRTRIWRARCQ